MQNEALEIAEASQLIYIVGEESLTTSLLIAEKFGKMHKNVLWVIETLGCSEDFRRLNFKPISYLDEQKRSQPMYEMTRDGFSLLVMGFTGKKAMTWKEKYIAGFNRMEQEIRRLAIQKATASGTISFDFIRQLLSEDRISRLALPDGTVMSFKKPHLVKAPRKEELEKDLREKVLSIISKLGSPTASGIQKYLNWPKRAIKETLDLLLSEGIVASYPGENLCGPKTTHYRVDS